MVIEVTSLSKVRVDHLTDGCSAFWELDGFGLEVLGEPFDLRALACTVKTFYDDEESALTSLWFIKDAGGGRGQCDRIGALASIMIDNSRDALLLCLCKHGFHGGEILRRCPGSRWS